MSGDGLWHPALTRWVDEVARHWSVLGVAEDLRERLRRDLVFDLVQARAEGASIDEITATDARRFAADVAQAEGLDVAAVAHPGRERRSVRFVLAGLGGSVAGALTALITIYPIGFAWTDSMVETHPDPWPLTFAIHLLAATVALAGGGLAVRIAARGRTDAKRVALIQTAALAVSGVAALTLAVSYASTTGFSTRPWVVATEILIVIACCVSGLSVGSRLSQRRPQVTPTTD